MRRAVEATLTLALLGAGLASRAAALSPAEMTPERIRQAITWGETAPESELEPYTIRADRTWVVNFDTPFLRVARLARAMKIQNQPITEEDISPKVVAHEVHLYAHARLGGASASGRDLPNIEYVGIARPNPNGPSETIHPISSQSFVRRVPAEGDYSGPARIARSVKAVFPLSALAPGNEVRIVFEGGAIQTVTLGSDLLARLR